MLYFYFIGKLLKITKELYTVFLCLSKLTGSQAFRTGSKCNENNQE